MKILFSVEVEKTSSGYIMELSNTKTVVKDVCLCANTVVVEVTKKFKAAMKDLEKAKEV